MYDDVLDELKKIERQYKKAKDGKMKLISRHLWLEQRMKDLLKCIAEFIELENQSAGSAVYWIDELKKNYIEWNDEKEEK